MSPGSQPAPPGPGLTAEEVRHEDATTAWAGGYCGAVSELVRSFSEMPSIDPSTPQEASRTSSELLGSMIGGLDRTLDGLDRLARAPVADGDRIKEQAVTAYTNIRDRAVGAKQQLDAATTEEASRAAIGSVRAPLDEIGRISLLDGFDAVPELKEASLKAPQCTELTDSGAAPRFDPGTP
ncbi:hypothetical protein [Prauserella cavernicola]|uniref:hypothetical protein n=1 Tax=Prauserella cavernicola TaxID=2800127 RepID=UPI0027DCC88F|nr:hypothetical protein [Prauserella cavernicola]